MNVNDLRYFKIPVKENVRVTIVSNNALVRSNMISQQNDKHLVGLIDDELWLLPNHKALREVFGKYGAGTVLNLYRKNKGSKKHKVRYDFKMFKEVSNKDAQKMINKFSHDKTLSMIINGNFYKVLQGKNYKEPAVMGFF